MPLEDRIKPCAFFPNIDSFGSLFILSVINEDFWSACHGGFAIEWLLYCTIYLTHVFISCMYSS
jgi:hypothetical protein